MRSSLARKSAAVAPSERVQHAPIHRTEVAINLVASLPCKSLAQHCKASTWEGWLSSVGVPPAPAISVEGAGMCRQRTTCAARRKERYSASKCTHTSRASAQSILQHASGVRAFLAGGGGWCKHVKSFSLEVTRARTSLANTCSDKSPLVQTTPLLQTPRTQRRVRCSSLRPSAEA